MCIRDSLEAMRAILALTPSTPVIVQAARLTRWKGQTVLIEALGRISESAPPWVAVLAGDDQGRTGYTSELEAGIARAGLENRVRLAGHVTDMPALFALATVTVIASIEPEAFGRTAIEAQMMGSPVIATNIGAPPETVLATPPCSPDHQTGWLIAPGDPTALAGALSEALSLEDDARRAFAQRTRTHAAAHFSLEAMKRATLEVYDQRLGTSLARTFEATIVEAKMSHPIKH